MSSILKMIPLVKEKYTQYEGAGSHVILFLACLIVLFILICQNKESNDNTDRRLFGYSLVSLIIYAFPLTAYIIVKFCVGKSVYWRMFWLFPITLIIAYVGTRTIESLDKALTRAIVFLGIVAVIVISGQNLYRPDIFQSADRLEKLPRAAVTVTDTIKTDAASCGTETIKGAFDPTLCCYIRQYDGSVKMAFGRETIRGYTRSDVYDAMNTETPDAETLLNACLEDDCNYIVLQEALAYTHNLSEGLEKAGLRHVNTLDGYVIYAVD